MDDLGDLRAEVEGASRALATERKVPEEVRDAIRRVSGAVEAWAPSELTDVDPYLLVALDRGLLAAWRGLAEDEPERERAVVRVALEQVRQALRDLADEATTGEGRPVKEVLGWLDAAVDAPQPDIAGLLRVSPRQYQRWLSPSGAEPRGDDARRVRLLAQLVAHLRHVWTGPGVVAWLTSPHPDLGGRPPAALLDEVAAAPRLRRLASATRSTRAA